jgi:hypothetical protein
MAGSVLTSGFDIVLEVNANNFTAAIEANQTLRTLANLGVIPLGSMASPTDPPPPTLTFRRPLQIRFYRSATSGAGFDLDLGINDARYNPSDGSPSVSLGAGRSYARVTAGLGRQTRPIQPPPPRPRRECPPRPRRRCISY